MAEVTEHIAAATQPVASNEWDGGAFPYRIGHRKLGMWLFIMSDSLTFCALLIAYSFVRYASGKWITPFPFDPSIIFSSIMTLVLLSSSLTMVFAVAASNRGAKKRARLWIIATMIFGLGFVILHGYEWMHLMEEGLYVDGVTDEWIADHGETPLLFGATFFTITGLHMFHVLTGVMYLGVIAARIRKFSHEDVETSGLYWHFVDLVWMFVFPLIYLLSVDFSGAGH